MIQSPLNYTGGKYKLLPQILPFFPENINTFLDLFCGGCNVGINVSAQNYIYNDSNRKLIGLYSYMKRSSFSNIENRVNEIIERYGLSVTSRNGYEFYNCTSSDGLAEYNRPAYMQLRSDFNELNARDRYYYPMLYVLIVYGFNNQIRFNRNGEFNLPVGKRDFNDKMRDKLECFVECIHEQDCEFVSQDFRRLDIIGLGERDFVYADPPYLITCASYNEQGGWTEEDEHGLLSLLDTLDDSGVHFALSNVLESKGRTNDILLNWIESNPNYNMIELNFNYRNSNYHRLNRETQTREILVIN